MVAVAPHHRDATCTDAMPGRGSGARQVKYRAEMDIDRDGDVDSTDQTLRGTTWVAALPKDHLSTPGPGSGGGVDNTVGWSGYRYDQPTRLYAVRFRFYDAVTFRWLNRDPAGYVDSMNLYGYGFGSGIGWGDPFGLGGPSFATGAYIDGDGFIEFDPNQFMSAWRREKMWFGDILVGTLWNLPGALAEQVLEELKDPLTWILMAIPGGRLLKPLLKGPGRALIKRLFRSGSGVRPGPGTRVIRFFYDKRSWKTISGQYWRKQGGAVVTRGGQNVRLSRDHWLLSQRFAKRYPWLVPWAHGYWNSGLVVPLKLNIFFYSHPWARFGLWGGVGTAGGAGLGGGQMIGEWLLCQE